MGGLSVWDGTVIEKWREIDVDDSLPDWIWKPCCKMGVPSEVEGYLALERVYHIGEGSQEQIEEGNNFDDVDIVGDETWDAAFLGTTDVENSMFLTSNRLPEPSATEATETTSAARSKDGKTTTYGFDHRW